MKTIKFLAIAMLLSCGFAAQVSAIDHYWIGTGGNTNWSTPGNWATTSGAAVSDVSFPPTINDNVIFDQNSFTTTRRTVTVNVASTCDSIIYRNIPAGVFNIPVLILNATLTVGGSVLLWPGMDIGASGQTIRLESTRLNETFSITGGETRINITFTGSANWTIDGNLLAKNVYLPHLTFSSTGNLTVNSDLNVYRFTFSSAGNLTVNGNLNATIVSVSGNGNVQILGNVNTTISASGQGFTSINKTGSGNMNISGNLFMSLGGATSSTTSFRFSDGGDLTIGGYALIEGAFSFSGDGNLTINNYLKTGIAIGDFGNQVITLNGTGTKIIKGDVTSFNGGISVNGGVVDIQGDLITSRRSGNNGSEANQPTPVTGANPNISGGCKITITGNILNAHSLLLNAGRLSISGAGTEVEVKGGYATLYDLYIVDGAKLIGLTETVELYGGWYNNNGGVDFTAATAPKLIRIGIGDFIANVNDVYNNVVVTNNPAAVYLTNNGYHTINRGNYNSIIIEKGSGRISTASQGVTTDSLIIKSQAEYIFSNTTAVNEHLEIKPPVCGGMTTVSGGTIAMGAGSTVDVEYLLLKNNTITGATPFDANNSIDAGENSGWNISGVPKTFYWVGGTGNWDDINHWADSPGGTPGSGCIPTLLDNVVFDGASGTVTIPANYPAYCNNMTWSGTGTARLTLTDAVGTRLYIGGSLELKSGMTVTNIGGSGTTITDDGRGIHFVSTRANETVSANGVAIGGNVYFHSGEIISETVPGTGGWVFQSNWAGSAFIYFQQGNLNFNGKNVTANRFMSNYSLPRTLNIVGSTVTMTYHWIYTGAGSNIMTNIHTENSLIKITSASNSSALFVTYGFDVKNNDKYNNLEFNVGSTTTSANARTVNNGVFNKVTLSGNSSILNGTIVTDSLMLSANLGQTYTLNNDITVNKYLQSRQDCGLTSYLTSNNTTPKTITMGVAGIAGENVKMKKMKITHVNITGGPQPAEGYPAEDCELGIGTETGWNITSSAGTQRYYWVGGTGNWSDLSHWSDVSGGAGGVFCNLPGPKNTVVFDENSFKVNNCIVTIPSGLAATCDSMLWIGTPSETPTLKWGSSASAVDVASLTVSGSLEFQSGMKTNMQSSPHIITFNSTRPKESLNTNGVDFPVPVYFNVTGEWDIPNGLKSSREITFSGPAGSTPKWVVKNNMSCTTATFNRGTLDLTGQTINPGSFTQGSSPDPNRELIIKNTTFGLVSWTYTPGILTAENSEGSVINFSGGGAMTTGSNQVYNDVNFMGIGASYTGTINAPSGSNTTQFRNIVFNGAGIVNNGKYSFLRFKNNGTLNTIEADTLRFANNNSYTYTFGSGTTSTINKKWYGSGLPCFRITLQSSTAGSPAYVNVKKEAATYHDPESILYLDYIYANGIIANQGPDLAIIEKGYGSPDNAVMGSPSRTYNDWTFMNRTTGWLMNTYDPMFNPFPTQTMVCEADFGYVVVPYQFVTTPESTYEWRAGGSSGTILNPGNPFQSTLTVETPGDYYLKVDYKPEGAVCVLEGTAKIVAVSTDSLIWTGAVNSDWNNPNNWNLPDHGGVSVYVPVRCTDVLIPKGLTNYPDLSPAITDYTGFYEIATCRNIHFEHGGEVRRTDSLHYTKAFVEMALNSNQWYMLSAPLRNTYSGDFYVTNPNPIFDNGVAGSMTGDGMLVSMMHFNIGNYQTGAPVIPFNWNRAFNTNDIEIKAGQGFALFANPRNTTFDQTDAINGSFCFPKHDPFHYYYRMDGSINGRGNDLDRTNGHGRFIYENEYGKVPAGGLVSLHHSSLKAGEMVLVGNPFMAQLDFQEFYTDNASLIYEEYKIAYGANTGGNAINEFSTYKNIGGDYYSTDPSILPRCIAPMQSFIVYAKVNGGNLVADIANHTKTAPIVSNNLLRSSQAANKELLYVTAQRDKQKSHALLIHWSEGSKDFFPEEDSRKLFDEKVTAPVLVYLSSNDGIALDINTTNDLTEKIPVGIRTDKMGEITLNFSGMEGFKNQKIFLHDAKTGLMVNLDEQNEYTFVKDEPDLFMENRLYLVFENTTGINNPTNNHVFVSNPSKNTIRVCGSDILQSVEIIDIQGRVLIKEMDVNSLVRDYQVNASGIYIVRVNGETQKVVVKS